VIRRALVTAAVVLLPAGAGAAADPPPFRGAVAPIPPSLRAGMTSWRAGCPVSPGGLRLLTVSHWGFDGRVRQGKLLVATSAARPMVRAMRALYEARFPIRRMRLVEAYGSDDDRSMAADNTSAFNCRRVYPGGPWSQHAYGLAIDINPLENPFVTSSGVSPPAGRAYLDRSRWRKGMIHADDAVVRAFRAIGWSWGGYWRSPKDYQHFSRTGT
jgi:hypothetical protein